MRRKEIALMFLALILPVFLTSASYMQSKKKVQIALLLDTSNSMDGLIDQAKSQLWKIVNEMATAEYKGEMPVLEIALYEYGNDNLSSREGYIRQLSTLSTDLDKISEDLFGLRTNGGSEFCGWVIQAATNQLDWSENANDLKMIFIAGNEGFTQGSVDYKKACQAAINKGIIVNTIFCGSESAGISQKWKDGADLADGKFMVINQNETVAYIESPYDSTIMNLNKKLNKTYIYYGSSGKKMKTRQAAQDANAAAMGSGSVVQRSVSKSSKAYKNSSWDLVDAVADEEVAIEKLDKEEMPEEFKGKTKTEVKAIVAKKAADRKKIQSKITELNKKREVYVTKERKKLSGDKKNTLDNAMLQILHEQGKNKGLKFNK